MRVLHVIQCISRSSGGPARSVQGLVAGLNRTGVEAWLLTLRKGEMPWVEGVEHFLNGNPFENALSQVRPQIVHLHGIWDVAIHRCTAICRRLGIKYIIAPRGSLEPWSLQQKWLKKRIARFLYQDNDLKSAAALHATAESEAEQFRRLGFKNPVIVSPNGVNVPKKFEPRNARNTRKRVLFVSRMHPKKGVLELVEAWNKLVVSRQSLVVSGWCCELVYTVNDEFEREYEMKVKARILELGMSYQYTDGTIHSSSSPTPSPTPNFLFTGALNDEKKWEAYSRADLFVLPTYSENFGIVVVEALWAGVPVITTKGTPWQELEERKCGWWIDIGVEPLANALKDAMLLCPEELQSMGSRGRAFVEEKYTWDAVVKVMVKGYDGVISG
ncbi:MAG: glycosyltransferase [Kiritimatiellae bacterium]|nr:glycosyltransferase [Kiritimatiellia bacterium]